MGKERYIIFSICELDARPCINIVNEPQRFRHDYLCIVSGTIPTNTGHAYVLARVTVVGLCVGHAKKHGALMTCMRAHAMF